MARQRRRSYDKALEGFTMFALNQRRGLHLPELAGADPVESIYDSVPRATRRPGPSARSWQGNPLDTATMLGAQASRTTSWRRSCPTSRSAWQEGAKAADRRRAGGPGRRPGPMATTCKPTMLRGRTTRCAIFQEEIFGPVVSVTRFDGPDEEAHEDRQRHAVRAWRGRLVAGHQHCAYRFGRGGAGRPGLDELLPRSIPAHAAFGGYKGVRDRPGEPQA